MFCAACVGEIGGVRTKCALAKTSPLVAVVAQKRGVRFLHHNVYLGTFAAIRAAAKPVRGCHLGGCTGGGQGGYFGSGGPAGQGGQTGSGHDEPDLAKLELGGLVCCGALPPSHAEFAHKTSLVPKQRIIYCLFVG